MSLAEADVETSLSHVTAAVASSCALVILKRYRSIAFSQIAAESHNFGHDASKLAVWIRHAAAASLESFRKCCPAGSTLKRLLIIFLRDAKKRDDLPCWIDAAKLLSFESIPLSIAPWGSLENSGDIADPPVAPCVPPPKATAPQKSPPFRRKSPRAAKKSVGISGASTKKSEGISGASEKI
jgi:hypothetical protein